MIERNFLLTRREARGPLVRNGDWILLTGRHDTGFVTLLKFLLHATVVLFAVVVAAVPADLGELVGSVATAVSQAKKSMPVMRAKASVFQNPL